MGVYMDGYLHGWLDAWTNKWVDGQMGDKAVDYMRVCGYGYMMSDEDDEMTHWMWGDLQEKWHVRGLHQGGSRRNEDANIN